MLASIGQPDLSKQAHNIYVMSHQCKCIIMVSYVFVRIEEHRPFILSPVVVIHVIVTTIVLYSLTEK